MSDCESSVATITHKIRHTRFTHPQTHPRPRRSRFNGGDRRPYSAPPRVDAIGPANTRSNLTSHFPIGFPMTSRMLATRFCEHLIKSQMFEMPIFFCISISCWSTGVQYFREFRLISAYISLFWGPILNGSMLRILPSTHYPVPCRSGPGKP